MYVTMMMTDQIPLDLAPPLLNGEVPLGMHMVNGDAAQQVTHPCTENHPHTNTITETQTHTHTKEHTRSILFVILSEVMTRESWNVSFAYSPIPKMKQ